LSGYSTDFRCIRDDMSAAEWQARKLLLRSATPPLLADLA